MKKYLREFVGTSHMIQDTEDIVYIGADLPDEYTGSVDTYSLKGTNAKAKANATQGIPQMINIAYNKSFQENRKEKHHKAGGNGWYRYESRFALPVYSESGEIERYNLFHVYLIVRHDINGKMYLYDIVNTKKETSNPLSYKK